MSFLCLWFLRAFCIWWDADVLLLADVGFGQSDYFSGKIRNLRIYNRALKQEEITSLPRKVSTKLSVPLNETASPQGRVR